MDGLFGTQTTTFHRLPTHRWTAPATAFRLGAGWSGLFFQPVRQGMAADPKDAPDAAHAGALIVGSQNLLPLLGGVSATRLEHAAFAALPAPELLTAAGIVTVLNNVGTAALPTQISNRFGYHTQYYIITLIGPLPFSEWLARLNPKPTKMRNNIVKDVLTSAFDLLLISQSPFTNCFLLRIVLSIALSFHRVFPGVFSFCA